MDTIFNGLSGWGKVGSPDAYRQKARKLHKIGPCEQGLRKCVIVNDIFMRETTNAYLR
jgi:hypothetical protein